MKYFTEKMAEEVFIFQDTKQELDRVSINRIIPMEKFTKREIVRNNLKQKIRRFYHGK